MIDSIAYHTYDPFNITKNWASLKVRKRIEGSINPQKLKERKIEIENVLCCSCKMKNSRNASPPPPSICQVKFCRFRAAQGRHFLLLDKMRV